MKITMIVIGVIILVAALIFGLELAGLGMFKFFAPKYEDAKREVFENTKSYTHGKIQDLAKYYEEYNKAESPDHKESIAAVIKMNFAEFDSAKIKAQKLRNFLERIRGY